MVNMTEFFKDHKNYKYLIIDNGSPSYNYQFEIKEIDKLQINSDGNTLMIHRKDNLDFFNLAQIERIILSKEDFSEKKSSSESFFIKILDTISDLLETLKRGAKKWKI